MSDIFEFQEAIRKERREARAAGKAFAEACQSDDVEALFQAVNAWNSWTVGGWPHAFREVLKLPSSALSLDMRIAFMRVWIEHKSIGREVDKLFLLTDGLRKLLPSYQGPALRLYRGTFWHERRGRAYGLSWTTDIDTAEKFATDTRQHSQGGSCILETDAPAEAIIGNTKEVGDYYSECEYLVDRRFLGEVRVVRRFEQLAMPSFASRLLRKSS